VLQRRDKQVQLVVKNTNAVAMAEHTLNADYYIMAADIPGIKRCFPCPRADIDGELIRQVDELAGGGSLCRRPLLV
jgi:isorenieratene synthase